MDWNEVISDFLADQSDWDIKTERWYGRRLRDFREFLATEGISLPQEIEVRHVKRYLGRLRRQGLKWSTRNGAYTILNGFCGWLARRGLMLVNPFDEPYSGLKRPRKLRQVVRLVPLDYIERMIQAAEREIGGEPLERETICRSALFACRDAAIMRLLITTGMRRVEVVRLDVGDLDLQVGQIPVIRGKSDHERVGYLVPETAAALRRWLAVRPRTESQALFVGIQANKKGLHQRLQPDAVNDICIKWRDAAGLPGISMSPHKWRHVFGTLMAQAGNPFALKELMGHADLKSTMIYVHTGPEVLQELVTEFAPVIGSGDGNGRSIDV